MRSHARANSKPPVIAWPLIAPMIGPAKASMATLGIFPTPMGHTTSPHTYSGQGAGSTLFWVDPERDLTFIILTAGLLEDGDSMLRFQRLSDLVVAATC